VIIGPVYHRERYETRYGLDKMMSVETIVERLAKDGIPAESIADFDAIAERIGEEAKEGDVVLVMSSGAFGSVHEKILEALLK
jgi:UDP-N-acetylmuramate-alanine ligase